MKNVLNYCQMLQAFISLNQRPSKPWLGITLVLLAATCYGLPEDNQQPIHIRSNTAIKDDKAGLTIYQGKVTISQGSLNIQADKVTIYSENETLNKIIAVGKPAQFKQQAQKDQGDVLAKASTIEYRIIQKTITLVGKASLDQDGSTITGNQINYDMHASRVEASSSNDSGPIQVVIPAASLSPKKK